MAGGKKTILKIIGVGLAVLVAAGGYAYYRNSRTTAVSGITLESRQIAETAQAAGKVSGGGDIAVSFQRTGQLDRMTVKTGDRVSRGVLLASLSREALNNQRRQQENSIREAELSLESLRRYELPQARQRVQQAAAEAAYQADILAKQRQLYLEGGLSEVEFRRVQLESEQAAASLEIVRQELSILENNTVAQRQLQIRMARESLAGLDIQLAQSKVYAPQDGIIIATSATAGEFIQAGQEIFRLLPLSGQTEVEVQADEKAFGRIRNGQKATVTADALPGQTFTGQVVRVAPTIDGQRGTFTVTVAVKPAVADMVPNLAVRVDIETAAPRQGLALEQRFVFRDSGGDYVWIAPDGLAQRQAVSTVDLGNGYLEITDGIQAGATVLEGLDLVEGQRVRITAAGR